MCAAGAGQEVETDKSSRGILTAITGLHERADSGFLWFFYLL